MRVDTDRARPRAGQARDGDPFLASMGIYVFNRDVLSELLRATPTAIDFGKRHHSRGDRAHAASQALLVPGLLGGHRHHPRVLRANLDADAADCRRFDLFDADAPIYTPPALPARLQDRLDCHDRARSIISDGCIINGASIERLASSASAARIERGARARRRRSSWAPTSTRRSRTAARQPTRGIPRRHRRRHASSSARSSTRTRASARSVRILNDGRPSERDGDGYYIRDGIVIVPKNGVVPDGTVIHERARGARAPARACAAPAAPGRWPLRSLRKTTPRAKRAEPRSGAPERSPERREGRLPPGRADRARGLWTRRGRKPAANPAAAAAGRRRRRRAQGARRALPPRREWRRRWRRRWPRRGRSGRAAGARGARLLPGRARAASTASANRTWRPASSRRVPSQPM